MQAKGGPVMILFAKPFLPKSLLMTASALAIAMSPIAGTQGMAQDKEVKDQAVETVETEKTAPPPMPAPPPPPPSVPILQRAYPTRVATEPTDSVLRVEAAENGQVVVVTGSLMDGSYAKVKRLLDATPKATTLILNSEGGRTYEGAMVANLVQKRKLNTHVEHFCMSACTSILASGQVRTLGPGARVGFHQARTGASMFGGDARAGAELGDAFMTNAYRKAGVDVGFIKRAMDVPWNDMWFPAQSELLRVRFVTALSPNTPAFKPTGKFLRNDMRAELLSKPFWKQALAAKPELFEQSVDMAWASVVLNGNKAKLNQKAIAFLSTRLSDQLVDMPDDALGAMISTLATEFSNDAKDNKAYCTSDWLTRAYFLKFAENKVTSGQESILITLMKAPVSKRTVNDEDVYNVMADVYVRLGENSKTPAQFSTLKQRANCKESADFFTGLTALPLQEKANIVRSMIRFQDLQDKNMRSIFDRFLPQPPE
jgi:hypothetical protein